MHCQRLKEHGDPAWARVNAYMGTLPGEGLNNMRTLQGQGLNNMGTLYGQVLNNMGTLHGQRLSKHGDPAWARVKTTWGPCMCKG